ncbi:MAG: hypothetical protein JW993_16420 [Sedimentisphaerales bacterium]|nr:hypothetical protein [Sedimentisphaerales bacterium]
MKMVALFDNEAGDDDLRSVAGHLRECLDCRAFCLDLIRIRRGTACAPLPRLSQAVGQMVLDRVRDGGADHTKVRAGCRKRFPRTGGLMRWAAVLTIGLLALTCLALNRTAKELRAKLGTAEQQVAAIHEQRQLAESEERQRKAISALYFRMAELEERVNRFSPSQRASVRSQGYEGPKTQGNL